MSELDATSTGQLTATSAEIYESFFVPALFAQWPETVLDVAGLTAGDDVLDVGCGTGVLARAAAQHLAGSGSVAGVDLNEGMLTVARGASASVSWRQAPAEDLPYRTDSFDRVVSQFALMFFADRVNAVSEMARVTRPSGTITVATWASIDQSPGYAAMIRLLDRLFGPETAAALEAPFSIGTDDELRRAIGGVLEDPTITHHDGVARFESLDAWVHTDVRGWTLADMIDDDQFDELLAAARSELAEFVGSDGRVRFPAPALIATASPGGTSGP